MSSNGKINHDLNQPQTPPSEEDIKTIPVSNISNSSLHPVTDESKEPKTVDADEGNGPQLRGSSICILLAAYVVYFLLMTENANGVHNVQTLPLFISRQR
jgi:hypothetical protein